MPTFYRSEHNESENVEGREEGGRYDTELIWQDGGRGGKRQHETRKKRHLLLMDLAARRKSRSRMPPRSECGTAAKMGN